MAYAFFMPIVSDVDYRCPQLAWRNFAAWVPSS